MVREKERTNVRIILSRSKNIIIIPLLTLLTVPLTIDASGKETGFTNGKAAESGERNISLSQKTLSSETINNETILGNDGEEKKEGGGGWIQAAGIPPNFEIDSSFHGVGRELPSQIESHQAVTRRVAASNRLYRERPIAGGAARLPRLSLSPFPLFVRHPPQLPRLFVSVTWRRPICLHESIESLPRCFDLSSSYQPIPRPLIISPYTFDQRSSCSIDQRCSLVSKLRFKVKSNSN